MFATQSHEQNVRMKQFGDNLRRRARALGMSDANVARLAGLSERRYGFYVTGDREPDLATLLKIARVLQVAVDDLLTAEEQEPLPERAALDARLGSFASMLSSRRLGLLADVAEVLLRDQSAGDEQDEAGR